MRSLIVRSAIRVALFAHLFKFILGSIDAKSMTEEEFARGGRWIEDAIWLTLLVLVLLIRKWSYGRLQTPSKIATTLDTPRHMPR